MFEIVSFLIGNFCAYRQPCSIEVKPGGSPPPRYASVNYSMWRISSSQKTHIISVRMLQHFGTDHPKKSFVVSDVSWWVNTRLPSLVLRVCSYVLFSRMHRFETYTRHQKPAFYPETIRTYNPINRTLNQRNYRTQQHLSHQTTTFPQNIASSFWNK